MNEAAKAKDRTVKLGSKCIFENPLEKIGAACTS